MWVSSTFRGSIRVLLFCILWCGMGLSAFAQTPTIHLTGVMQSGDKSIAYVDGSLYQVGELLPSGDKVQEVMIDGIRVSTPEGEHYYVPVGNPAGIEKLAAEVVPETLAEPEEPAANISFVQASEPQEEASEPPEEAAETAYNISSAIMIVSIVVVLIGAFISTIGEIWYIVACFQESIWWGLGVLFLPFVSLFFLFMHWDRAKKPFLLGLVGILIVIGGGFIAPSIYLNL